MSLVPRQHVICRHSALCLPTNDMLTRCAEKKYLFYIWFKIMYIFLKFLHLNLTIYLPYQKKHVPSLIIHILNVEILLFKLWTLLLKKTIGLISGYFYQGTKMSPSSEHYIRYTGNPAHTNT